MFESKRGQSLSMNTIIIGILVLVVLVVIIAFFTSGSGTVMEKVSNIFSKSTSGDDLNLAIRYCKDYCTEAQDLIKLNPGPGVDSTLKETSYCRESFKLDVDHDGKINGAANNLGTGGVDESKIYCNQAPINVNCPGINPDTQCIRQS